MATDLVLDGSRKTGFGGGGLSTTVQNSENLHKRGEDKVRMKKHENGFVLYMFDMTAGN